jgi:nucleotide-binding universal stress UspA family protein
MSHFPTKILLATDGSKDAFLALRAAVDLSARTGSELHVVHAWLPFPDHSHPSIAVAPDAALYEREAQKLLFEELDKVEAAGAISRGGVPPRRYPTLPRNWRSGWWWSGAGAWGRSCGSSWVACRRP